MLIALWMQVRRATAMLKNRALARPSATRAVMPSAISIGRYLIAFAVGAIAPALSLILFAKVTSQIHQL